MKTKRWITLAALFLIGLTLPGNVKAESPFYDYTYNEKDEAVSSPRAYDLFQVVDGRNMGITLNNPGDLVVKDNEIYIADTGNHRIVVLNNQFHFVREWSTVGDKKLASPEGLFITDDGTVLTADSQNGCIYSTDKSGKLRTIYKEPETDILPKNFEYKPIKVASDKAGRLFVVSQNFNMGLLQFDNNGLFVQTLGAAKVKVSFSDIFWRLFSTEEQQKRMQQFVPTEYNNLSVDDDGFVYTTTAIYDEFDIKGYGNNALKKLNASGNDILKHTIPLGERQFTQKGQFTGPSRIVDVYTGQNGCFSILDANRGRVFNYDGSGTLLYIFGGYGDREGGLKNPCAIDKLGEFFLVLDRSKNTITVFSPTTYAKSIDKAVDFHYHDKYDEEAEQWNTVLNLNVNSDIAYLGIGKAAFRSGNYKKAMDCFKTSYDKTNYSKAFQYYRRELIAKNFMWFVPFMLAVMAIIIVGVRLKKKYYPACIAPQTFRSNLSYGKHVIFHPFDGFWDLKREKRGGLNAALFMLFLLCLVQIFSRQLTGFIFSTQEKNELNIFLEICKVILPYGLWCISNWCVSSLMQGEGKFKDIAIMTGYSLIPIIITQTISIFVSNILSQKEGDFYLFFVIVGVIWSLFLLLIGHQQTHNYEAGRSLFVFFLTLLVMAIVIFLGVLMAVLFQQMIGFGADLINEIVYRI